MDEVKFLVVANVRKTVLNEGLGSVKEYDVAVGIERVSVIRSLWDDTMVSTAPALLIVFHVCR